MSAAEVKECPQAADGAAPASGVAHSPTRVSRLGLLLVFLLALGVRVTYVLIWRPAWPGSEMVKAAKNLATTGTLGGLYGPQPTAHVTPLYPALLALFYRVWGLRNAYPQQLFAALTVAVSVALIPVLARRLGLRPAAGWVAAVFAALLPMHSVEVDGRWEQPLTGVVLMGLLLLAVGLQDCDFRSWLRVAAFGLLVAFGGLLAPAVLPAAGLALLGAWLVSRAGIGRGLAAAAAVAAVCLLTWSPWIARNYVQMGGFVPLRSNFGLEFRLGNSPGADGNGLTLRLTHPSENEEELARLRAVGELAYMREQQQKALGWVADHPGTFAALCGRRFLLFWFPTPDMCMHARPRVGLAVSVLFRVTAALALLGLPWLFWTRHRSRWLLTAGLLGPSLVYVITHVLIRYHYPVFHLSLLAAAEVAFLLAGRVAANRLKPSPAGIAP
jgi:hypothetical protein